jgi:hypothetical protein
MEPENEQFHSFQFCEQVAGVEHDYRITEMANHVFGLEKDGVVVAEVTNDCEWKQLSGVPVDNQLLHKICDRIEEHYA